MKIRDLIARLQEMDQDLMVVKSFWQPSYNEYRYETMDSFWFTTHLIRPSSNVANDGHYYEANEDDEGAIEALPL